MMAQRQKTGPNLAEARRTADRLEEHLHQLAYVHKETLRAWEAEQADELDTDPELSRKLAAFRTEMRSRQLDQLHRE